MAWKKILAREYGVQYTELSLKCLTPINKDIVPAPFYEQIYVPENGNEVCYIDEAKWDEFVSALKEKYLENPDNYEEFERLFIQTGNDYMATAEKIAKSNLGDKSNGKLKEIYLDYSSKNIRYGPFIWMQFIINNFFSDKAKEIIENKMGKNNENLHNFIELALKPDKKAASIQLSDLAAKWESLDEDEKSNAYQKFQWLPCLDVHNRPWTKQEFFSHISEFKKTGKTLSSSYRDLVENIKPSNEEMKILNIAKRLSYLKDLKNDFRRQGVFYGQKLFEEIAGRMSIKLEDISYMMEKEIMDFLDKGSNVSKTVIEERKRGFAIYYTSDKELVCKSGTELEAALEELGLISVDEISEEIKGVSASRGKASGTVKVVRGVSDLTKIKKGDILVAVTTHPDYVVAMHKAAAIVTDEGGMTSHAAIVSRELGIPCIVGTRNATKALKDGDIIEIDASKGIVRKIKH